MRKETDEFDGRNKEIIEIKSRAKATMRPHVFFHHGPGISLTFACHQHRGNLLELAFTCWSKIPSQFQSWFTTMLFTERNI
jgi:hypothetical protein